MSITAWVETSAPLPKISALDLRPSTVEMDVYEQETLDFINSVRRDLAMLPIRELPQGTPGNAGDCVIARGLGGYLYMARVNYGTARVGFSGMTYAMPPAVAAFVDRFDHGDYPRLVAR